MFSITDVIKTRTTINNYKNKNKLILFKPLEESEHTDRSRLFEQPALAFGSHREEQSVRLFCNWKKAWWLS